MSSSTNPAPVSQPAPARPKFDKPVFSAGQPVSWLDWTGYYTITFVTVRTRMEAAAKALPKGLKLTPSYALAGMYPILLSIGIIEDARPRVGTWIGVNYYEVFSAIPGVQLEQPGGGSIGPYLYPYRGFLNRLLPVFLGRLSGFRKYWDRVQVEAAKAALGTTPKSGEFSVKTLLGGNPVMDGQYTYGAPGPAEPNQRVDAMRQLLPPNIIGVNPFGKLCRSVLRFPVRSRAGMGRNTSENRSTRGRRDSRHYATDRSGLPPHRREHHHLAGPGLRTVSRLRAVAAPGPKRS